jgi:hypothetical protein
MRRIFDFAAIALLCAFCGAAGADTITLSGKKSTTTESAIIVDALADCQDHAVFSTTAVADIGNATPIGSCDSAVSVFSMDNAMSFEPKVTTWTSATTDDHLVDLTNKDLIEVPVQMWVAIPGGLAKAADHISNADLLFNRNRVGVKFIPTIVDLSSETVTAAALVRNCFSVASLLAGTHFIAGRLNVYYNNNVGIPESCTGNDVILTGEFANISTLAHEIGHAFGMRQSEGGHTTVLGNLMTPGSLPTRNHLTLGQVFRMNVNGTSELNVDHERTGATRDCPPNTSGIECPDLMLDTTPLMFLNAPSNAPLCCAMIAAPAVADAKKRNAKRLAAALKPAEIDAAQAALNAWLDCLECVNNELEKVTSFGVRIVPSIGSVLDDGPPTDRIDELRKDLGIRYDELLDYQKTHSWTKVGSATKKQFVDSNIESVDTQYRVRAAVALGAIGGPLAKKTLQDALQLSQRATVRKSIEASVQNIK